MKKTIGLVVIAFLIGIGITLVLTQGNKSSDQGAAAILSTTSSKTVVSPTVTARRFAQLEADGKCHFYIFNDVPGNTYFYEYQTLPLQVGQTDCVQPVSKYNLTTGYPKTPIKAKSDAMITTIRQMLESTRSRRFVQLEADGRCHFYVMNSTSSGTSFYEYQVMPLQAGQTSCTEVVS